MCYSTFEEVNMFWVSSSFGLWVSSSSSRTELLLFWFVCSVLGHRMIRSFLYSFTTTRHLDISEWATLWKWKRGQPPETWPTEYRRRMFARPPPAIPSTRPWQNKWVFWWTAMMSWTFLLPSMLIRDCCCCCWESQRMRNLFRLRIPCDSRPTRQSGPHPRVRCLEGWSWYRWWWWSMLYGIVLCLSVNFAVT